MFHINHHEHDQQPFWNTKALHLLEDRFICTSVGSTITTCSLYTGSWSKKSKAHETCNQTTWRFVDDHADRNLSFFLWGKLPSHDLQQSVQVIYSQRSCNLDFLKLLKPVLDARPHRDGTNLSEAVKKWFTEQLYLKVSELLNLLSC